MPQEQVMHRKYTWNWNPVESDWLEMNCFILAIRGFGLIFFKGNYFH